MACQAGTGGPALQDQSGCSVTAGSLGTALGVRSLYSITILAFLIVALLGAGDTCCAGTQAGRGVGATGGWVSHIYAVFESLTKPSIRIRRLKTQPSQVSVTVDCLTQSIPMESKSIHASPRLPCGPCLALAPAPLALTRDPQPCS